MYSWNTTIDDSSSVLTYQPYSDGSIKAGWATWYSGSQGNFNTAGGEESVGQSLHLTQFPGASVYMRFEGSAVYVYGQANCSYTITLDSQTTTAPLGLPYGLLYYNEELSPGSHSISLTATPEADSNQIFTFDKMSFTSSVEGDVNGLTPLKIDNQNTTALQYNGNWSAQSDKQIPSRSNPSPYHETSDPSASVSLDFTGAAAVSINAPRNWGHWTYNVSLDGETSTYNASTWWLVADTVLFYQAGLDPSKKYQIQLTNAVTETYYKLSLNYFTLSMSNGTQLDDQPSPSPSQASDGGKSSKVNAGVIAGPIVAGVVIIVALVAVLLWWRRRRPAPTSDDVVPFPPDERAREVWHKRLEAGDSVTVTGVTVPSFTGERSHRTDTSISATPQASSTTAVAPPSHATAPHSADTPGPAPGVDLDQIIQAIAYRIDPRPVAPGDEAPPRYPA